MSATLTPGHNEVSPAPRDPKEGRSFSLTGSLIRRSKSNDILGQRKPSGRLRKKAESAHEEALRRQQVQNTPPKLPGLPQQPQLQSFGGEEYSPRLASAARMGRGTPPVPPIPATINSPSPSTFDPYARTESMTNRGRYSYAHSTNSTLNSPRRVRRRKDPTPYNVLIIGARNSGKTSFLNFLKQSLVLPPNKQSKTTDVNSPSPSASASTDFVHHYQEIEVDSERIGLTLWDSQGLDKSVVDLQLPPISRFVESKFEETFAEEQRVVRSPGLRDTHIHCVFLILDPQRLEANMKTAQQSYPGATADGRINKPPRIIGALDEDFDIQVLRALQGKTTVIPVISKADTITTGHMAYLKKMVVESLRQAGLDPLEALNFESDDSEDDRIEEGDELDDADDVAEPGMDPAGTSHSPRNKSLGQSKHQSSHKREVSSVSISATLLATGHLPFSILNPDPYSLDLASDGPIGRKFAWGFADPYNPEHCDFVKLKDACFKEWRAELREASRQTFYERWRFSRLNRSMTNGAPPTVRKPSYSTMPNQATGKKR